MNKDLEVRQCRVLVAVKDHGGVAAAARALALAQSTVSETLLSLERILGVPITVRRPGGGTTLTAAAETLLPHARALIAASEAALAAFASKGQAPIRLGAVESISSFLLPRPLSDFRARWPRTDVQITIGLCEDLRKRVGHHELDVALTIEGTERSEQKDVGCSRKLSPAQLRLVVSPGNPLAQRVVGRADLGVFGFLLADPDGAFNELLRAWLRDSTHALKIQSAGSVDGVKRGVKNSDVIGVLPSYAVAEDLASGTLVSLKVREPVPAIALLLTTLDPPVESSALHSLVEQISAAFAAANEDPRPLQSGQ